MSDLVSSPAWQALLEHRKKWQQCHLRDLFASDPDRFVRYSVQLDDLLMDYSKHWINDETMTLLMDLARSCRLDQSIKQLFAGAELNHTENRPVMHTALRNSRGYRYELDGQNINAEVERVLLHMASVADDLRSGKWLGFSGSPVTDIVNIGIGGSDLGPALVCDALSPYGDSRIRVHFLSNIDGAHITRILDHLDPATTLIIVASKTFTTQETIENAKHARQWILQAAGNEDALTRHMIAVTANINEARRFGIAGKNIFEFWDWVGGRFSLWSSIGLPIAIYLGMDRFRELLAGAEEMDIHFRESPLENNMPVLMAMLGIWYINFFDVHAHGVFPYDQLMEKLPAYLRQAEMESNGKQVDREGRRVDYATAPFILGEVGTTGQHSFYQLFHQGTRMITSDFLLAANAHHDLTHQHMMLASNYFAQTEAFMLGRDKSVARMEMEEEGLSRDRLEQLLPYRVFEGNRPSTSLLYRRLTPRTLGTLIALYEHKIFVQGVIWNINSFDQWGVELGKQLARNIQQELTEQQVVKDAHDSSTTGLIAYFLKLRSEKE